MLFALVRYGLGPGLVAAAIAKVDILARGDVVGLVNVIYVAEAAGTWLLLHRIRSLPLAVTAFWFLIGLPLDLVLHLGLVDLDVGFVVLVFVKQVVSGLLAAVLAEAALALTRWRREHPEGLQRVLFARISPFALLPSLLLAMQLMRTAYQGILDAAQARNTASAQQAGFALRRLQGDWGAGLRPLTSAIEIQRAAGDPRRLAPLLREFRRANPAFQIVGVAATDGTVLASDPDTNARGAPLGQRSIAARHYFQEARDRRRTTFGSVRGVINVRRRAGVEDVIVVGQPVLGAGGEVAGVVYGSHFVGGLESTLDSLRRHPQQSLLVFDRSRRLVAAAGTDLPVGTALRAFMPDSGLRGTATRTFAYDAPGVAAPAPDLPVSPQLASLDPLPASEWGVVASFPSTALRRELAPVALLLLGLLLLALGLIHAVTVALSRRLAEPLVAVSRTANAIAAGDLRDPEALGPLAASPVAEVRSLAADLVTMQTALKERQAETEAQRTHLEQRLAQAERLEALGRLAGGVAHDFNNLLTPIVGYAELVEQGMAPGSAAREDLQQIREAATRARDLVKRLLALGRRQLLEMRVLDPNGLVLELEPMLRRLIAGHTTLLLDLTATSTVRADPVQLQQVLLNLVVNAQEAIGEDGGTITIRTADRDVPTDVPDGAAAGRYAALAVSDTGAGIATEVRAHIFEPFFTTKGRGSGSGLGLATVYGIVRQHGGAVEVLSPPGSGATFTVLLPVARGEAADPALAGDFHDPAPAGARTVLLAEDEPAVRRLTARALRQFGYQVLEAGDADQAEAAASQHQGTIDLLVTDVVMPGRNGRQLHEALRRTRPGLKVLYISGYTDDVLAPSTLGSGAALLPKPFTMAALAQRVGDLLDEGDQGRPQAS